MNELIKFLICLMLLPLCIIPLWIYQNWDIRVFILGICWYVVAKAWLKYMGSVLPGVA